MSRDRSFDDALDSAIDAIARGEPLEAVLAAHPHQAGELYPLLVSMARELRKPAPAPAPSARLATNFRTVRATIDRARPRKMRAAWWRRPVSFASLSLPAGVFALAAFGGAAAAGGAVAAATSADLPAKVQHVIALDFAWSHAPLSPTATATPPPSPQAPAALPGAHPGDHGSGAISTSPLSPARVDVEGRVTSLTAFGFLLQTEHAGWDVTFDGSTAIVGTLADGAHVEVTGDATGRTLRATRIEIADASDDREPEQGDTPEADEHDGTTPEPEQQDAFPSSTPGAFGDRDTPESAETPDSREAETSAPEGESTERPAPTETPEHEQEYETGD